MAKKRRIRYDRIVLCVLVSILLIAIIVVGIRFILKDDSDTNTTNNTTEVVSNEDIKIELNDYTVYEDKNNDLGFNFVVANLKFTSDKSITYDLSNLKTNEGVVLSNVLDYSKQLTMASYNFDSLNTTTTIQSTDKELTAKVFIPYKEGSSITLIDSVSNSSLFIDLSKNKGDIDSLKKTDSSTEIVSNDYNISIANNYVASNMYHNGVRYEASMLNVYMFKMTVNSISNGVKITNATFKQASTSEEFDALDASYYASIEGADVENILDKELKTGDTYALYFEVFGNSEDEPDYKGTITIKFSDGTSKTIDTELN